MTTTRTPPPRPKNEPRIQSGDTAVSVDVSELDAVRSSQSDIPTVIEDIPPQPPIKTQRLATLPMGWTVLEKDPGPPPQKPLFSSDPGETTLDFQPPDSLRAAAKGAGSEPPKSDADTTSPWGVTPPEKPKEITKAAPIENEAAPLERPVPETPPVASEPVRVVSVTAVIVTLIVAMAIITGAGLIAGAMVLSRAHAVVPPEPSAKSPIVAVAPSANSAPVAPIASTASSIAPSTSASAAPATSDEEVPADLLVKELGAKPSKAALDKMIDRVRPALEECASGLPKAIYLLKIDFDGPTGTAAYVETPNKELKSAPRGTCVLRVGLAARVPPFAGTTSSHQIKFAPK